MELSLYDKEAMDRARHRGRAYQCVACHFQKGERWVDELWKLEDHILRTHIEQAKIPFFCRLCRFKCVRKEQLVRHISHYARHLSMAAARQIVDHAPWLTASQDPYKISELDYRKLSQEDSLKFFLGKQGQRQSPVTDGVAKLVSGSLDINISQETLRTGYISDSPHMDARLPRTVTSLMPQNNGIGQLQTISLLPRAQPGILMDHPHQPIFPGLASFFQQQQVPVTPPIGAIQGGTPLTNVYQAGTSAIGAGQAVKPTTDAAQGRTMPASEVQTVTSLMGLDCSPAGSASRGRVSLLPTPHHQPSVDGYEPEPMVGSLYGQSLTEPFSLPFALNAEVPLSRGGMTTAAEIMSQGKTTHDAEIDVSTSLPHAEAQATGVVGQGVLESTTNGKDSGSATEVAYSSEVVEDIREQLLAREEMRLTSPVLSESEGQKRKMDEKKHGEGTEGEKVVENERRGDNKSGMPADEDENRKVTGEETTEPQTKKQRTDAGPTESSV